MGEYNRNHMLRYIFLDCRIGAKSKFEKRLCQQCGKEMVQVSVTFRIPKKEDENSWKKVKKDIIKGKRYNSIW